MAAPTDSLYITILARAWAVEIEAGAGAVRPRSQLGFREVGHIMRVGCKWHHY